ncbi:MAG: HAD-IB family phosphatase [Dehalococcoidales bacterium]|nr:HAD-IB family phosphatase [Dehalococcoidales bacterium]
MQDKKNILVQCDFDGTITIEDASFAILDAYLPGKWEALFKEHQEGKMSVGEFNTRVFSMVKADKETLLKLIDERVRIRDSFQEFVRYCRDYGYRIVIVSNGLDFYIKHILNKTRSGDLEFHASITTFDPGGLTVRHRGPDGNYLDEDVKVAYTDSFLSQGYDVIYLGDGSSDIMPAKKCSRVFATGNLVSYCERENLECIPFKSFQEVIREMRSLN